MSETVKIVQFMLPANNSDAETLKSKLMEVIINFCSTTLYMYTMNDPVIEASSGLKIAPFNIGYPKLIEQAKAAELNP